MLEVNFGIFDVEYFRFVGLDDWWWMADDSVSMMYGGWSVVARQSQYGNLCVIW